MKKQLSTHPKSCSIAHFRVLFFFSYMQSYFTVGDHWGQYVGHIIGNE